MQIDVLSQNTLKLTLSKLDMFDLDIKYESLSGKNPETKRLLSHVIRSIQSDEKVSFDFSGERLFIEAFPRIDGGCMLYISCLEDEPTSGKKGQRKTKTSANNHDLSCETRTNLMINNLPMYEKNRTFNKEKNTYICELDDLSALGGLCKTLCRFNENGSIKYTSTLYENCGVYRLVVKSERLDEKQQRRNNFAFIRALMNEFGSVLEPEECIGLTEEYFNLIAENNAAELITECV